MAETDKYLSAYHLGDDEAHRAWQPGKKNFFTLIVDDIDSLVKPGIDPNGTLTDNDYITNGSEVLRLTVHEANIPHYELATLSIRKGNSVSWYAGVPTFDGGEIQIDDMVGAQSKAILEAWQNLAYDVISDKGGRAINYKKTCHLIEYTADYVKVRQWELLGCWVSKLAEEAYNKETDDIQRITATIQYDRAIPHVEGV